MTRGQAASGLDGHDTAVSDPYAAGRLGAVAHGPGRLDDQVEGVRHSGAAVTADAAHRRRAGGIDLLDPGVTEHGCVRDGHGFV
jgi:hypothetical protein